MKCIDKMLNTDFYADRNKYLKRSHGVESTLGVLSAPAVMAAIKHMDILSAAVLT
jgi:hypothetical protein